jgi:hypothetical protein
LPIAGGMAGLVLLGSAPDLGAVGKREPSPTSGTFNFVQRSQAFRASIKQQTFRTDFRSCSGLQHNRCPKRATVDTQTKVRVICKGTLDPFPVAAYALQAGVSQATGTHAGYGQGVAGYGKRFGAALLDGTSARFFGTYAFPSLLHQDPRYFRKGEGSAGSRARYSITRGFVTRSDSGKSQPNWSNLFGKFTAAGLSNLYYPAQDRGADLTLTRVAISLSYQTLGNLAIEFWPEIHKKVFGGNKPKGHAV